MTILQNVMEVPVHVLGRDKGMGIRESDTDLKDKFNAAITSMKEDGSLNELIVKWFGGDTAPLYIDLGARRASGEPATRHVASHLNFYHISGAGWRGCGWQRSDLVLAHGWPRSSFGWHWILPDLARHYRIHWYDIPRFGVSEMGGPRAPSLDVQGEIFGEMLDA